MYLSQFHRTLIKKMIINEEDGNIKDLLIEKENQKVYVSEDHITKKKSRVNYSFDKTNNKLIYNILSSKDIEWKEFHFKCSKL